jgi:hypothetical protein
LEKYSFKDITIDMIKSLYLNLSSVKPTQNAVEIIVENHSLLHIVREDKVSIKTYNSIKECAKDMNMNISPKTRTKYLNTGPCAEP